MNHYEQFLLFHQQTEPLVLANAWNAKSAQLIEKAGFKVIGTSSGAIAESLGYMDGENIHFDELLYMIKRSRAASAIPLSVDIERGYTDNLDLLNEYIQQLLDIGVAGINIEDAQGEDIYLKKLDSIKNYLLKTSQHLFINARTDGFLQKLASPLELTIQRAARYQQAGADGLFVTAVPDYETIEHIAAATSLPLNVVATPKLSSVSRLTAIGVRRISMAVFLYKAAYQHTERIASSIVETGRFDALYA